LTIKVGEISLLTSLIIIFVVYMSGSQPTTKTVAPSAVALIPLIVFLALFIGVGTYLSLQGVEFAFYPLPAPIAGSPAIIIALLPSNLKS
ncbi:hypothetical protein OFN55_34965, partial [Escherichia coli]|nr:hypothetical protein [Escherichia coli]